MGDKKHVDHLKFRFNQRKINLSFKMQLSQGHFGLSLTFLIDVLLAYTSHLAYDAVWAYAPNISVCLSLLWLCMNSIINFETN